MFPISISPEEIAKLELVSFPGEIVLVDSLNDTFYAALRYLRRQKVLGFDTETRPTFTQDQHSNGTALLQLSGATRAYLFRVQKTGIPRRLAAILANPAIIKVGAATIDDDRHHPWGQDFQGPAAFKLGSGSPLGKPAPLRRNRCLGVP